VRSCRTSTLTPACCAADPILCLLPAAYLGPENWLAWAEGSADGKTIADVYRSGAAGQVDRCTVESFCSQLPEACSAVSAGYRDTAAALLSTLLPAWCEPLHIQLALLTTLCVRLHTQERQDAAAAAGPHQDHHVSCQHPDRGCLQG
jgi:hypothetical protein